MDTFRCVLVNASHKVLVDILCHERNHRRCCFCSGHKGSVQGHISIDLILLHTFCPETLTASSHIPVAHLIHKVLQRAGCLRDAVVCQVVIHGLHQGVEPGQQPFIHNRKLVVFQFVFCRIKVVDICIQHKERVGIPQGTHEFTLSLLYSLAVETVRQPGCAVYIEIPADGISPIGIQSLKRINGIAL